MLGEPQQFRSGMGMFARRPRFDVFFVCFSLLVAFFFVVVVHETLAQWRTTRFVHADGIVLESSGCWEASGRGGGSVYRPHVRYEYSFQGAKYQSTQIRRLQSASNRETPHSVFQRSVHPGERLLVFVNPADPTDAVLLTGLDPTDWALAGVLGALFLVAVFGWSVWTAAGSFPPRGRRMKILVFPVRLWRPHPRAIVTALVGTVVGIVVIAAGLGAALEFTSSQWPYNGLGMTACMLGTLLSAGVAKLLANAWQKRKPALQ